MAILGLLLMLIASGLALTAYVWIIVIAFNNSPGWGVACLLCGPAQLVFLIMNWEECQNPAMCWAGGFILYGIVRFAIGI